MKNLVYKQQTKSFFKHLMVFLSIPFTISIVLYFLLTKGIGETLLLELNIILLSVILVQIYTSKKS